MTFQTTDTVSRRATLAGLSAGGIGLAFAASTRRVSAQDASPAATANHPMVGAWLVAGRLGPSMTIYGSDGTFIDAGLVTSASPAGVVFASSTIGVWEPVSDRGIHFTAVQVQSDADGTYTGTLTINGHPTASEDGRSFSDDDPETTLTFRDAANNVLQVVAPYAANDGSAKPRTGIRIAVDAPGLPDATPTAATPTS